MKQCSKQLPLGQFTHPYSRTRREAAWKRTVFRKKSRQAPIHTRAGPLLAGLVIALLTGSASQGPAQTTELVSRTATGGQGNGDSRFGAISPDGRFVVFQSRATNLVAGDTNAKFDVFLRDRLSGTTERVSLPQGGGEGNGTSDSGVVSANGRFVAFRSDAFNLTGGESNPFSDIFVRDRVNGTTERISAPDPQVVGPDGDSLDLAMSADGRFVAFDSRASNLVPGDTNGFFDIFLRDRISGTTQRISGNGDSLRPAISADGRYVAFDSTARNLTLLDTNGFADIFVRDRVNGTTE